jgi:two-component system, cell cycle sensor histidine kinase and response regulator CckA
MTESSEKYSNPGEDLRQLKENLERLQSELSEIKSSQNRLSNELERYRQVIRNAEGITYELRFHCGEKPDEYVFISPEIEFLTGLPPERFTKENFSSLVIKSRVADPDYKGSIQDYYQSFLDNNLDEYKTEILIRRPDGQTRWLSDRAVPVREPQSGRLIGSLGILQDISEQKSIEARLCEQRDTLQTLLDSSPAMIFFKDRDNRILRANRTYYELTGFSPENISNRTVWDRAPDKATAELYWKSDKEVIESGRPQFNIIQPLISDPSRQLLTNKAPTYDEQGNINGIVGTSIEITEWLQDKQALKESEEIKSAILEALPDTFLFLDIEGRIIDLHTQEPELLLRPPEELPGQRLEKLLPKKIVDEALPLLKQAIETKEQQRMEYSLDFGEKTLEFEARLIRCGPDKVLCIIRDVTKEKRREKDRRKMEQRLLQMEKAQSLNVLAGSIAHNFNNLLMAIQGNIELAMGDCADGQEILEYLKEATRAAHSASELSNQMLIYVGQGKSSYSSLNLSDLVREIQPEVQKSVGDLIRVNFVLEDRIARIQGDRAQLRQVVMNLVNNAAESINHPNGEISITTGASWFESSQLHTPYSTILPDGGEYVFLEVRDNGCGMDSSTLEKIFDPFFTTRFIGRGMGLAAVQGIMKGHDGLIQVESRPGAGTTFRLLFPMSHQGQTEPTEKEEKVQSGKPVILIAEDEESIQRLCTRMLNRAGYEVMAAWDGREAVEVFRNHHQTIDCILMDLIMPRMTGEEALLEIYKIRPDIPVIISSGYNQEEILKRFSGIHTAGFIHKPFKSSELVELLDKILQK